MCQVRCAAYHRLQCVVCWIRRALRACVHVLERLFERSRGWASCLLSCLLTGLLADMLTAHWLAAVTGHPTSCSACRVVLGECHLLAEHLHLLRVESCIIVPCVLQVFWQLCLSASAGACWMAQPPTAFMRACLLVFQVLVMESALSRLSGCVVYMYVCSKPSGQGLQECLVESSTSVCFKRMFLPCSSFCCGPTILGHDRCILHPGRMMHFWCWSGQAPCHSAQGGRLGGQTLLAHESLHGFLLPEPSLRYLGH